MPLHLSFTAMPRRRCSIDTFEVGLCRQPERLLNMYHQSRNGGLTTAITYLKCRPLRVGNNIMVVQKVGGVYQDLQTQQFFPGVVHVYDSSLGLQGVNTGAHN